MMLDQDMVHPNNLNRPNDGKVFRGASNGTTMSATSDEDVLKGAYGGHITAGGDLGDEAFPRDKLRAINDEAEAEQMHMQMEMEMHAMHGHGHGHQHGHAQRDGKII